MTTIYCDRCSEYCRLSVIGSGAGAEISGNGCMSGIEYARAESSNPVRTLTTTVRTSIPGLPAIAVKTNAPIKLEKIKPAIKILAEKVIDSQMEIGDVLIDDIADTGVSVIITGYTQMQLGQELENKTQQLAIPGINSGIFYSADGERSGGVGVVRNPQDAPVLDDLGADGVGGFIGTAGGAVGIEGASDEDNVFDDIPTDDDDSPPRGRSHIRRRPR